MRAPRMWVTMSSLLLLPIGALWSASDVHADPVTPNVAVYAAQNTLPVCTTIAHYPTVAGVTGIVSAVMEDGNFTAFESGQVVALAVTAGCPSYWPVLQRFIAFYSSDPSRTYAASGKVGGSVR